MTGGQLPSSRFVSLVVHGFREDEAPITMLLPQWGQLIGRPFNMNNLSGNILIFFRNRSRCHSDPSATFHKWIHSELLSISRSTSVLLANKSSCWWPLSGYAWSALSRILAVSTSTKTRLLPVLARTDQPSNLVHRCFTSLFKQPSHRGQLKNTTWWTAAVRPRASKGRLLLAWGVRPPVHKSWWH